MVVEGEPRPDTSGASRAGGPLQSPATCTENCSEGAGGGTAAASGGAGEGEPAVAAAAAAAVALREAVGLGAAAAWSAPVRAQARAMQAEKVQACGTKVSGYFKILIRTAVSTEDTGKGVVAHLWEVGVRLGAGHGGALLQPVLLLAHARRHGAHERQAAVRHVHHLAQPQQQPRLRATMRRAPCDDIPRGSGKGKDES